MPSVPSSKPLKNSLDAGSRAKFRLLYPDFAVRCRRLIHDMQEYYGMPMRCTEGVRTWARQQEIFNQGRTTPGPVVTRARPGQSYHNYGLAADFCFRGSDPFLEKHPQGMAIWKSFGRLAQAHGLVWGGDFSDMPHVQLTYGFHWRELIEYVGEDGCLERLWAKLDRHRGVREGTDWLGPVAHHRAIELGHIDP